MTATEESMNTQLSDLKAGQDALEAGQRALAELNVVSTLSSM